MKIQMAIAAAAAAGDYQHEEGKVEKQEKAKEEEKLGVTRLKGLPWPCHL